MRRTIILGAALAAIMLWNAAPAALIQDGTIDTTGRYPNVLCLWAEWDVPGQGGCATGQLIGRRVVLTAGHLTVRQEFGGLEIRVSTAAAVPQDPDTSRMIPVVRAVTHPEFFGSSWWKHDVGVLILARPINGVPLVQLPTEGLLDDLHAEYDSLDGVPFTAVGYGVQADDLGNWIIDTEYRRYGPAHVVGGGLPAQWFNLDFQESGITPGDSGSCVFLSDSFTCVASYNTRMDTPSQRSFLAEFVAVP